jgi:hypothetical protein
MFAQKSNDEPVHYQRKAKNDLRLFFKSGEKRTDENF